MDTNPQWQPPAGAPLPPPPSGRTRSPWLPAAIIGSAIVVAAGLVAGALILKDSRGDSVPDGGMTTCQAWTETRLTLRAIPALPNGWTWDTPNIDNLIKIQNAPVAIALDLFEPKIAPEPADVARAANAYVAARRQQMQALTDRTYTPKVGETVDAALENLNQLCDIPGERRRI